MTRKILRDAIIFVFGFLAVWLIIAQYSKPVSINEEFIPSAKKEKIIDWIEEQISKTFKVSKEDRWNEAIDEVLAIISSSEKVKNNGYEVIILDNDQLNAFATIGTKIYFFSGLLDFIENHQELGAILAHEIGHIELNHIEQKLITEFGLVVLSGILTGGDIAISTQIIKDITSGVFSRSKENEADQYALELMEDVGIDPVYMGLVFKKLKDKQSSNYDLNFEILSSHPDISKRIKKSFDYVKKSQFKQVNFQTKWPVTADSNVINK